MNELIIAIAALITAVGSIVGTILSNRRLVALLEYRMGEVEKRLDQHNHYAEKFSDAAVKIAEIQKDIEYMRKANEK